MTVKQFYEVIGGDYDGTLARFLDEDRMLRFALRFENDPNFSALLAALKSGNADEAFRAAHTLKGVCQNLGFTSLFIPAAAVTEILRTGSLDVGAELMDELKSRYGVVITAIGQLKA